MSRLRTAIEHLARSLAPVNWADQHMAVVGYFDASGHEKDQTHVVVAGFLSSERDWATFETQWKARLSLDDLPYFRATDFAHSLGPFDGWRGQEKRRRDLSRDLMKIVQSNVYRLFGSGVSIPNLRRTGLNTEDSLKRMKINAYVLGGRTVAADVAKWFQRERFFPAVSFVFEDGDEGQGALSDLMHEHNYPRPVFKPKLDRETPLGLELGVVQLQAADWLAYELFQVAKRLFLVSDPGTDLRWALKEFRKIPGEPGFFGPAWNPKHYVWPDWFSDEARRGLP